MSDSPVAIYGLTDVFGQVKYIGMSKHPVRRYREHCLAGQLLFGIAGLTLLEHIPTGQKSDDAERRWIALFGLDNLWNKTRGGNGAWAYAQTEDTKRLIGAASKGMWERESYRTMVSSKMSMILKVRLSDPAGRQRFQEAAAAANRSPQGRINKSNGMKAFFSKHPGSRKGMPNSLEHNRAISDARKKEWADPVMREKRSRSIRGAKQRKRALRAMDGGTS